MPAFRFNKLIVVMFFTVVSQFGLLMVGEEVGATLSPCSEALVRASSNDLGPRSVSALAMIRAEVKEVTTKPPYESGKWFCETGGCIGYSWQLRDALMSKFPEISMKMTGPHAYVFQLMPDGTRIIIDPTWKQFYQGEGIESFPDILVVDKEELVATLVSLNNLRVGFDINGDGPWSDLNAETIHTILTEIYDFAP